MKKTIIHISQCEITPNGGMGRVEYHWKEAFEKRNYQFIHVGPKEIGPVSRKSLLGYKLKRFVDAHYATPDAYIVHEPFACFFKDKGAPLILESHGVEPRAHAVLKNLVKHNSLLDTVKSSFFSTLRNTQCRIGLKAADKLLLLNNEDINYAVENFGRSKTDILGYRNGVVTQTGTNTKTSTQPFTALFNGSFIKRKGIDCLVAAADILSKKDIPIHYLIVGTGVSKEQVLSAWPAQLHPAVEIIPKFDHSQEQTFLDRADVFLLPSYFEGQPLSLLQAMAAGICSITTNCCGQKDIIQHGYNGLLFEPGNAGQLAELIEKVYIDNGLQKLLGANAAKSMRNRSWEECSNEVVDFVETIF